LIDRPLFFAQRSLTERCFSQYGSSGYRKVYPTLLWTSVRAGVGRVRGRRDLARKGLAGGRAREAAFAALGNHTDSLDAYYKLVLFLLSVQRRRLGQAPANYVL